MVAFENRYPIIVKIRIVIQPFFRSTKKFLNSGLGNVGGFR